jgi:glycosyltransferase involved in cell wall biosynthesis
MIFHVVSLPHTQTTRAFNHCAYTSKVIKFCNMMHDRGHTVYLYASEDNEARCKELIPCITKEEQFNFLGEHDWYRKGMVYAVDYDNKLPYWKRMNTSAIVNIKQRIHDKNDFICLIAGHAQKPIADATAPNFTVEYGIGYEGVFSRYRCFESYAWMHYVYGRLGANQGSFQDAVIPNYFDVDEFPFEAKKDDYFLFMSRMTQTKGYQVAIDVTKHLNAKLRIAGIGGDKVKGSHIEHAGLADSKMRGELLSKAKAVFMPTLYIEPFGGLAIEAMLCGTPVISTDWGAFAENNIHGVTGYRFRSMGEAIWAAQNVGSLDPHIISNYARSNFSLERVGQQYEAYFNQLSDLWDKGWYSHKHSGVSKYSRYKKALDFCKNPS